MAEEPKKDNRRRNRSNPVITGHSPSKTGVNALTSR